MTDDRLLTNDALAAMAARAEAATPSDRTQAIRERLAAYEAAKHTYIRAVELSPEHTTKTRQAALAELDRAIEEVQVYSTVDLSHLLALHDAQAQRIAVLEADAYQRDVATRQDERNATIKDMRRHLADELRKLGLCNQETISLTEVVDMVRQQNDRIAALEDALLCVASMVGVEEATIPPGSTPADVAGLIRDALAAEIARLREALADIKLSASAYAASVELPRIIPGMTEATYEHGILKGMTVAAEAARRALEGGA